MTDEIRRYKDESELDGDETLAVIQAEKAGRPTPKFERDEYAERRIEVLEAGGLVPARSRARRAGRA